MLIFLSFILHKLLWTVKKKEKLSLRSMGRMTTYVTVYNSF